MALENDNILYEFIRRNMNLVFKAAFRKIEYVGLDNVPNDGAIIFAPNHTSALMDALTVLTVRQGKVVFVARADIFNNKRVAKILNFFKIMPIVRQRDGMQNLKKNDKIMERAVEVLCAGVPFCIFSEGTQRLMHSLMPLTKGVFRIALHCVDAIGENNNVYIVPVGIEYGSYTTYRGTLLVNVGEAINVSDFVNNHRELDAPEMINAIRPVLSAKMGCLIHNIPATQHYEGVLALSYMHNKYHLEKTGRGNSLYNRMLANRATVDEVSELTSSNPAQMDEVLNLMDDFAEVRNRLKITDDTLYNNKQWGSVVIDILLSIVALPYAVYCMIVNLPIALVQYLLTNKLDDMGFANSIRIVLVMFLLPIILLVILIVGLVYLPTLTALLIAAISLPANIVTNDYCRFIRNIVSDCRMLRSAKLKSIWQEVKTKLMTLHSGSTSK